MRITSQFRPDRVDGNYLAIFGSLLVLTLVSFSFWYFQIGRHASKLACSLAKFRRPQAHRCADAAEMLAAAESTPGPAQVYFIGRPKRTS